MSLAEEVGFTVAVIFALWMADEVELVVGRAEPAEED
jgi:hypothetical protein